MNNRNISNLWIRFALFFLLITSLLGLIIRLIPLQSIIDNSYFYGILQSHSHMGFLGWVFLIIYYLIFLEFGDSKIFFNNKTKQIFGILTFFISGMTISFPFTGYSIYSISFLTLFLGYSYYAIYYLNKNLNRNSKFSISRKYIKTAFLFYLLSSISPWLLGPIMALGYKKTALYYNDIFFYLHFLYNGFVTFSIIGLFIINYEYKLVSETKRNNLQKSLRQSFTLLTIGTILNYSESVLWNKPHPIFYIIAFISSILLILGIFKLSKSFIATRNDYSSTAKFLLYLSILMFVTKTVLQLFQSFPIFADISFSLKSQFIIGYIHLVTLGFITPFILSFLLHKKILINNLALKIGVILYVIGYTFTEIVLFSHGIFLWNSITILVSSFNQIMFYTSLFLFFGLSLVYLSSIKKK